MCTANTTAGTRTSHLDSPAYGLGGTVQVNLSTRRIHHISLDLERIAWGTGGQQSASPERCHFHLSFSLGGFCREAQAGREPRQRGAISIFLSPGTDCLGNRKLAERVTRLPGESQAGRARHQTEAISIFLSPLADSVGKRASPERRHFHLSFSLGGLRGEPQVGAERVT
jgi:hypothetical protein